jgi:membrane associated rhomboid family serine protease
MGPIGFLVIANLILFIATSIKPALFIDWFGLYPAEFLDRPWTIITNLFIHSPFTINSPFSSIWHILANMITLYFFGSYVVRLVGDKYFLIIYFLGGIVGNAFYILIEPFGLPAIGASGAVFAIAGALTVMRPNLRVFVFPIPVPIPLWVAVIGGFLILSFVPYVAWQAHLGGLAVGLIAGYIFRRRTRFLV